MSRLSVHMQQQEAQHYLKAGELRGLLGRVDRMVLETVYGGQEATRGKRRLTVRGIEKKTGLSGMAVILSCYRLTGLGLLAEKAPPKGWKMPKRTEKAGSLPRR
jgi:hypothetical protein